MRAKARANAAGSRTGLESVHDFAEVPPEREWVRWSVRQLRDVEGDDLDSVVDLQREARVGRIEREDGV